MPRRAGAKQLAMLSQGFRWSNAGIAKVAASARNAFEYEESLQEARRCPRPDSTVSPIPLISWAISAITIPRPGEPRESQRLGTLSTELRHHHQSTATSHAINTPPPKSSPTHFTQHYNVFDHRSQRFPRHTSDESVRRQLRTGCEPGT